MLPDVISCYCPIEPAVHPRVDEIERTTLAWVESMPLAREERARVARTNSAEFFSRFAPAGIAANVGIAARWVYWGFAFDDARCDSGALSERPAEFAALAGTIQRCLEEPRPVIGDDPYAACLHDIAESFRRIATPVQVRRFAEAHRRWLAAVCWQVGNRARRHMPDLDEYLAMRLGSCGGPPTFAMLEIANGAEVPCREMDVPAVRALTEMACLVAGWDNDLHSYLKERAGDEDEQNVVTVLAHTGRSVPDAVAAAFGIRDAVLDRFLQLRDRLRRRAGTELRAYLDGLGHGIRGNIDWALRTPRYALAEQDTAAVEWRETPAPSPVPPPPSIAWWWDDLTLPPQASMPMA
jgi:hypothetical protein